MDKYTKYLLLFKQKCKDRNAVTFSRVTSHHPRSEERKTYELDWSAIEKPSLAITVPLFPGNYVPGCSSQFMKELHLDQKKPKFEIHSHGNNSCL